MRNKNDFEDHDGELNKKFKFEPPLYLQRYFYVIKLLKDFNCSTYMDIGCAECNLLRYAKNSNELDLNLIVGVDLDEDLLKNSKEKFNLLYDLVQPRNQPLDIYLIKGDISQPASYFLDKVSHINTQIDCLSLVEVIEHMYPETLKNTLVTVFGKIKPRLVVMTTPNSEFNVVFEDEDDSTNKDGVKEINKFRHWDHKFEWTRREFQDWCENDILNVYKDYSLVKFDGLGMAPSNYDNVGFCTQIAIFIRNTDEKNNQNQFEAYLKNKKRLYLKNREIQLKSTGYIKKIDQEEYFLSESFHNSDFNLIFSIMYPFECFDFENEIDRQNALLREIDSIIKFLTVSHRGFGPSNDDQVINEEQNEKIINNIDLDNDKIRLTNLSKLFEFPNLKKFKYTNENIFEIMKENNYEFTKSLKYIIYRINDESNEESNNETDENENYFVSNNICNFYDEEEWL